MRVLIAEDEWLIAFALRRQLEREGWVVVGVARDGEEAVDLCCRQRPDLVLMDVRMPKRDGIEATRRIMAECPACVVMLTARTEADQVALSEDAGAMGHLVKPVSTEALLRAIGEARARYDAARTDSG
jgi:response regulator NasT